MVPVDTLERLLDRVESASEYITDENTRRWCDNVEKLLRGIVEDLNEIGRTVTDD